MGIIQEKFQVEAPPAKKPSNEWVSDASVRRPYRPPAFGASREGMHGGFDALPPGTRIEDQERARINGMSRVNPGESDVTVDYSQQAIERGYTRRQVSPYDDAVTNEHWSPFYRTADGDEGPGFLERNNGLDRQ